MTYRARAYPYPVISSFSNDFGESAQFSVTINPAIATDDAQKVILNYAIVQSNRWLDEYILDGNARLVLDVECRATLLREYFHLHSQTGHIDFEPGQLYGSVLVTPIIVAAKDNDKYQPAGVDAEFGTTKFSVRAGDILGVGDSTGFEIEFTRTLEQDLITILYVSDIESEDVYRFNLDGPRIVIIAGESLRNPIGLMRTSPSVKPYLYMSIYKDCVAAALDYLATADDSENTERPWGRALLRRLTEIGRRLVPDDREYQQISAQLLVRSRGIKKVGDTFV